MTTSLIIKPEQKRLNRSIHTGVDQTNIRINLGAETGNRAQFARQMSEQRHHGSQRLDMRTIAATIHADDAIEWIDARLPELESTRLTPNGFDIILANAVWMHVPTCATDTPGARVCKQIDRFSSSDQNRFLMPFGVPMSRPTMSTIDGGHYRNTLTQGRAVRPDAYFLSEGKFKNDSEAIWPAV